MSISDFSQVRNDNASPTRSACWTSFGRTNTPGFARVSFLYGDIVTLSAGGFIDTVDLFAISPSLPPGSYSVDSTVRTSGGLVLGIATQP